MSVASGSKEHEAGAARKGDDMTEIECSPTVEMLVRFRRIDKAGLTVRDILMLYTIIANPGINGLDAAKLIGIAERSSVQLCLARLIKRGFIEDRRDAETKGVPNILHSLPAGIDFWNEIKL